MLSVLQVVKYGTTTMLATLTFPTTATMHICALCEDDDDSTPKEAVTAPGKRPAPVSSGRAPGPVQSVVGGASRRARKRARKAGPMSRSEELSEALAEALERFVGMVGPNRATLAGVKTTHTQSKLESQLPRHTARFTRKDQSWRIWEACRWAKLTCR